MKERLDERFPPAAAAQTLPPAAPSAPMEAEPPTALVDVAHAHPCISPNSGNPGLIEHKGACLNVETGCSTAETSAVSHVGQHGPGPSLPTIPGTFSAHDSMSLQEVGQIDLALLNELMKTLLRRHLGMSPWVRALLRLMSLRTRKLRSVVMVAVTARRRYVLLSANSD